MHILSVSAKIKMLCRGDFLPLTGEKNRLTNQTDIYIIFSVALRGIGMLIDIKNLFEAPDLTIPVEGEIDLANVEIWGQRVFGAPVRINGLLRNRAGIVSLQYSADIPLEYECDRCRKKTEKHVSYSFEHMLARELSGGEENDEFLVVPDGMLNMDELVMTDVTLELPFRFLCKEDCKGLCPICGADLNETECGCQKEQTDPRLAKLKELLDS